MKKYIILGGSPLRSYTGTVTIAGLKIVGKTDSITRAYSLARKNSDECGCFIYILNAETGEFVKNL